MALARLLILLLTAGCTTGPSLRHEPWPPTSASPVADQHGWQRRGIIIPGHPQRATIQEISNAPESHEYGQPQRADGGLCGICWRVRAGRVVRRSRYDGSGVAGYSAVGEGVLTCGALGSGIQCVQRSIDSPSCPPMTGDHHLTRPSIVNGVTTAIWSQSES